MKLVPTRYFSHADLQPYPQRTEESRATVPEAILKRLETVAELICNSQIVELSQADFEAQPDVAVFLSVLQSLGGLKLETHSNTRRYIAAGPLARELPRVLFLLQKHGFAAFDDWNRRSKTTDDRLGAIEFLHHTELERIECSKRAGFMPEVLNEIPVAYAIIKARSRLRQSDVYLVELNKDWNRYNLIGGKQEKQDAGDFRVTLLREIEEEIGVPRRQVRLTPLNTEPLISYSLSGHRGVLARYPCHLFHAQIQGRIPTRAKDRWVSEEELIALRVQEDPGLMISSVYLDYILNQMPGGLKSLAYSTAEPVDCADWYDVVRHLAARHKEWIVAVLAILAAVIAALKAVLK